MGVGAEETVIGGVETVEDLDAVGYLESESDVLQVSETCTKGKVPFWC